MQIVIDTNFILTCVKQKIDLFEQLEDRFPEKKIVVPSGVIEELGKLTRDKKLKMSERSAAELALQLVNHEGVLILDLPGNVDDSIVKYALKNKVIVASLDRGIKKRLKNNKFLTIRKGKIVREA